MRMCTRRGQLMGRSTSGRCWLLNCEQRDEMKQKNGAQRKQRRNVTLAQLHIVNQALHASLI